jgi:glucose/arabinose dehydrogenase
MPKPKLQKTTISFVLLFSLHHLIAQPVLTLSPVITGLNTPIELVNAGDGTNRMFIVHQGGSIVVYSSSYVFIDTFLKVSNVLFSGEQGLLSMAFPPDYDDPDTGGFFYVYYVNTAGNLEIARYHVSADPNVADASTKTIVLTISHPTNANHNGGTIRFGPDGYLYLATGDGGGGGDVPNNAQNGLVLLGKMLRIAVDTSSVAPFYTIPASNPYVNATDTLHEIYSFGLRNPFRWAFDSGTMDIWIADVGQGAWEEINHSYYGQTAGLNYGWHCYEGNATFNTADCNMSSTFSFPVYTYANTGIAAITGGPVYRGTTVPANAPLTGYHLAADFYSGNIYKTRPNGASWLTYVQGAVRSGISDFGVAENGEIFAVSLTAGNVSSITVTAVLPVELSTFAGDLRNGSVKLNWRTSSEQNLGQFEIEYSIDGNNFNRAGIVIANNTAAGADYSFDHSPPKARRIFYRLKMIDRDNHTKYSGTIMIRLGEVNASFVQPSVVSTGIIHVLLDDEYNTVELIGSNGALVIKQNISGRTGAIDIPVPAVIPGTYIVQLRNGFETLKQKIIVR